MGKQFLKDRIILITGASSGLGAEIAYQAALQGATLIITARNRERLEKVAKRCAPYNSGNVASYQLDVANQEQVQQVIAQVYDAYGRIDILVNNAGFGLFKRLIEFELAVAEEMFQVNVLGLIHLTQLVAEKMITQGSGQIINVSSQGGKMATPKSSIYSATKFAVLGFSNALRLELKPHNIQVTTVNPGPIRTNFFARADQSGNYLKSVQHFVLEPEYVAKKVVQAMRNKKREVNLPFVMELGSKLYNLFPYLGDYFAGTVFNRK